MKRRKAETVVTRYNVIQHRGQIVGKRGVIFLEKVIVYHEAKITSTEWISFYRKNPKIARVYTETH